MPKGGSGKSGNAHDRAKIRANSGGNNVPPPLGRPDSKIPDSDPSSPWERIFTILENNWILAVTTLIAGFLGGATIQACMRPIFWPDSILMNSYGTIFLTMVRKICPERNGNLSCGEFLYSSTGTSISSSDLGRRGSVEGNYFEVCIFTQGAGCWPALYLWHEPPHRLGARIPQHRRRK